MHKLKKIVSYLGENENRKKRNGEVDGWDYLFVSPEEIVNLKNTGKLLQFIEFNNTYYGYPFEQFEDLDELIIVCGGSGTGKDTILKEIYNNYTFDKKIGFLFSVPDTITIFTDYAEKKGIKTKVFYFTVLEEVRLERILREYVFNLEQFDISRPKDIKIYIKKIPNDFLVEIYIDDQSIFHEEAVQEIIKDAKDRVLRDRKKPFGLGIDLLRDKLNIVDFDFSNSTLEEAVENVVTKIKE